MLRLSNSVPEWMRNILAFLMVGVMIQCGWGVYQLRKFSEAMTITQQNRVIESQVHLFITKAESSQRGYVLTGNDEYLRDYYASIEQLRANVRTLVIFLQNQPQQAKTLSDLSQSIDTKIQEMDAVITDVRQKGPSMAAPARIDKGMALMHRIEDTLNTLIAQERNHVRYLTAAHT